MNKFEAVQKYIYQRITGKVKHLKKGVRCKKKWYGSDYGGFYLHPDIINSHSIVYSFGIGTDITFDKAIIENHQCQVFGFDPTPKSIEWVKSQSLPELFNFNEYGIHSQSGKLRFYMPQNESFVSGSATQQSNISTENFIEVPMKSLGDIIKEKKHSHIDVLKIDIEGSEYELIDSLLETDVVINQILIEFHDRYVTDGKEKTKKVIRTLKEYGFEIFGISNTFEEISFIRKDILRK